MTDNTKQQQLLSQVTRAREALGNALGLIQDVDIENFDVGKLTHLLATSVRSLFTAEEKNLEEINAIKSAMKNLRDILQMMQDVNGTDPRLQAATTTVARILAILFPVYKELSAATHKRKVAANKSQARPKSRPASVSHDERRAAPRKQMEVDIGGASDSNFFTGFTTDISSGGLFVATYNAPQIGHFVNLNFKLPKGPVISVDGEVCWTREFNETTPETPPGVGVKFLKISAEDAESINSYMKQNQPLFYDD